MHKDLKTILTKLNDNGVSYKVRKNFNNLTVETDLAILDFYRGGKLISVYNKETGLTGKKR